jgi:SAM-dependent methyltransferase
MVLDRFKYWLLYRIGFTPWDGHPQAQRLTWLVESEGKLASGKALDIGCGTGDASIYLAQHGWEVTALDFLERPLGKARAKAQAASANIRFVHGDVTRLASYGVGSGYALIVDNGCLHGLDDTARDAYVREINAVAGPGANYVVGAFLPGKRGPAPRGIDRAEIERRFSGWELVFAEKDPNVSPRPDDPIHVYHLHRR